MNNQLRTLFFTLVYIGAVLSDEPLGTCYYPGLQPNSLGDAAPGYYPCDGHSYMSQCCPIGFTCLSNLLCEITDPRGANSTDPVGTVVRATCTNALWNNQACGSNCIG